jgi:hypothetical protein
MKKHLGSSKPVRYSAMALSVSAIALSVITLVAVYFKFDGVIQIKLGMDGGQVLIDGRQHTDTYQ